MTMTGSGDAGGGARPKQTRPATIIGPGGDAPSRLGATASSGGPARAFKIPRVKDVTQKKLGTAGNKIALRTNHFPMKLSVNEVWHYDVKFQLPFKRDVRNSDKPMLFRALEELKRQANKVFKRPDGVIFDGMSNAYSVEQLPFGNQPFQGQVEVREVEDLERKLLIKIKLQLAGKVDMGSVLHYCRFGDTSTRPTEAVTVINTLLSHMNRADAKKLVVGRSMSFLKDQGPVYEIGGGKSLWIGAFTSFRPAWKPSLNVDMANKPGYEEDSVTGFCLKVLNERARQPRRDLRNLRDFEVKTVSQELKGLKIRMTINPAYKRDLKANGLGPPCDKPGVVYLEEANVRLSIADYFRQHHNVALRYAYEPSVWVGSVNKKIYYPMELCNIKKQACPNSKRMTEDQTTNMIRRTAVRPEDRKKRIEGEVKKLKDSLGGNGYAREFGLSVEDKMSRVEGRVLPAPQLGYKEAPRQDAGDGPKKDVTVPAKGGKWAMGQSHHFVEAKSLKVSSSNFQVYPCA